MRSRDKIETCATTSCHNRPLAFQGRRMFDRTVTGWSTGRYQCHWHATGPHNHRAVSLGYQNQFVDPAREWKGGCRAGDGQAMPGIGSSIDAAFRYDPMIMGLGYI